MNLNTRNIDFLAAQRIRRRGNKPAQSQRGMVDEFDDAWNGARNVLHVERDPLMKMLPQLVSLHGSGIN